MSEQSERPASRCMLWPGASASSSEFCELVAQTSQKHHMMLIMAIVCSVRTYIHTHTRTLADRDSDSDRNIDKGRDIYSKETETISQIDAETEKAEATDKRQKCPCSWQRAITSHSFAFALTTMRSLLSPERCDQRLKLLTM